MLLTDDYKRQQAELHATGKYGTASRRYGRVVSALVEQLPASSLLDYGCGSRRSLLAVLDCDVRYQGYDPAVPEFSFDPDPADLLVCIDVLEHIEPECLDAVLDHMASKSPAHVFLTVHTGPALKVLSDGRNAHLIQQPAEWWLPLLMKRWRLRQFTATNNGFSALFVAYSAR